MKYWFIITAATAKLHLWLWKMINEMMDEMIDILDKEKH